MSDQDDKTNPVLAIHAPGELPEPKRIKIRSSPDGRTHKALTTIDETPEEHVYLFYKPVGGRYEEIVLEADLLGDRADYKSDGSLPPVIHIECPRCTKPEDRQALSITHYEAGGSKHFEIEELDPDKWYTVLDPKTERPLLSSEGKPVLQTKHLTVKEVIKCPSCQSRYKITDCQMRDV
jgi:hypothetical protein